MDKKKLGILKRQISRLSLTEIKEIRKHARKIHEEKEKAESRAVRQENFKRIRGLPQGTKIICLCQDENYGKIGKIVRHLGRGSVRTVIDFGGPYYWRYPSLSLSDDFSEAHLKQIELNLRLRGVVRKALGG